MACRRCAHVYASSWDLVGSAILNLSVTPGSWRNDLDQNRVLQMGGSSALDVELVAVEGGEESAGGLVGVSHVAGGAEVTLQTDDARGFPPLA